MVLDQENHGIPICFLLFSPPGGSVRTSSNYDHSIIKKLILAFHDHLGKRNNIYFEPKVILIEKTSTQLKLTCYLDNCTGCSYRYRS